jgi:site-specific DNA-methyltransferase (adenine-specific)
VQELIKLLSKENDIVLDPFCGSGTTCVAAKNLKRKYIGIEINPEYVQLANERLKQTH